MVARALFLWLLMVSPPPMRTRVPEDLEGAWNWHYIHPQYAGGRSSCLGGPTTGNSGGNPGRPRRCERVSVGSSYLLAIVTFVTRRPDASKLVSQKTCLHVLCGALRGTDATQLKCFHRNGCFPT